MARKRRPCGGSKRKPAVPEVGKYTKVALQAERRAKEAKLQLLDAAVAWCIEHGVGPWIAVKEQQFEELKPDQVLYHMRRSKRSERDILTPVEKNKVYIWIKRSADRGAPVTEATLQDKVRSILQARLAYNRAHHQGAACTRLSTVEKRIAAGGTLSHTWLSKFNAEARRRRWEAEC